MHLLFGARQLKGSGRCIAEAHEARQGQCGIHFRPQWKSSPNASPWLFDKDPSHHRSVETLGNSHGLNRNKSIIFEPPFRKTDKEWHVWVWTQTSGSFSRRMSTECGRLPKWKKWLLKLTKMGNECGRKVEVQKISWDAWHFTQMSSRKASCFGHPHVLNCERKTRSAEKHWSSQDKNKNLLCQIKSPHRYRHESYTMKQPKRWTMFK